MQMEKLEKAGPRAFSKEKLWVCNIQNMYENVP